MNIAVLLKQVPDSQSVRLDPDTGTLIRDPADAVTNPLDLCALGAAVRLAESLPDSEITALSMGPAGAEQTMRQALALGAAQGVLICDRACAGSDTYVTALILAAALEKFGPFDLVLTGQRASDGETGQVGPEIAARLGIPVVTGAESLRQLDSGELEIGRVTETEKETIRLTLPAVVSAAKGIGPAPLPTLKRKSWARREPIITVTASDLGLSHGEVGLAASPTRVVKILRPSLTRKGELIRLNEPDALERAAKLVRSLIEEGGRS